MMKYLYYPGCSCSGKATGTAYSESLTAVFEALQVSYDELEDWNCCGATMYMGIDAHKSFAMATRNLALAERQGKNGDTPPTIVSPCAACYAVLNKTKDYLSTYQDRKADILSALKAVGLSYQAKVQVRHPLDVLVNDIGLDNISRKVKRPLEGWRVASYYGCLLLRPYATFDDPYAPTSMDNLMAALGATPVEWSSKTRCCGASLSGTIESVALRLSQNILAEALGKGAQMVVTACPFCQFNLECFQNQMPPFNGSDRKVPVAFFTQLLGLALGLSKKQLGMQRLFIPFPEPPVVSKEPVSPARQEQS